MPVVTVCHWCGGEMTTRPSRQMPSGYHYCTRQCAARHRRVRPRTDAEIAGRAAGGLKRRGISPSPEVKARISATLAGRPNPAHTEKMRGRFVGEKSGRWNPDATVIHTGHKRARAKFPLVPCAVCGRTPDEGRIERHHVDRNPFNNDPKNVVCLCPKHHRAQHPRKRKEV